MGVAVDVARTEGLSGWPLAGIVLVFKPHLRKIDFVIHLGREGVSIPMC